MKAQEFATINQARSAAVKEMLRGFKLPITRTMNGPLHESREYRGKRQCVVGYTWSRPYSHYASGLVYDVVLGAGETFEEALEKAKYKVQRAKDTTAQ